MVKRTIVMALSALLFAALISACGGRKPPPPPPTPTLVAVFTTSAQPAAEPTAEPSLDLIDNNLLDAALVSIACDAPEGVEIACSETEGNQRIEVAVNESTYARLAIKFDPVATPLTGHEVLTIRARGDKELKPNLYLADAEGARMPVSLRPYILGKEWKDLHIPLQEIRAKIDEHELDLERLNELQIVFEWGEMAGALEIADLRFESVLEQAATIGAEADELAAALIVPDGFAVEPVADNLREMTQIVFTPDGDMLVSLQNGRIWWYEDNDDDGLYDQRRLYAVGKSEVVGLLYDPVDATVWLGGRGQLYRAVDEDGNGVADSYDLRVDGLPWGRHQNNGLAWNPDPDPFSGEPGNHWIYFGLGSTEDLEIGGELNATVLRYPRQATGNEALEVVSDGNRNAYMVVWAPVPTDLTDPDGESAWQLFASENGPDFNDSADEVNHIRWQHHYGFPDQYGTVEAPAVDGDPYSGPLYPVTAHASSSGMAYISNAAWPAQYRTLYTGLFGQVFGADVAGHTVERIALSEEETLTGATYRGEPSDFVVGLDRPLPMATGPSGDLIVGDYASGVVYRVYYVGNDSQ